MPSYSSFQLNLLDSNQTQLKSKIFCGYCQTHLCLYRLAKDQNSQSKTLREKLRTIILEVKNYVSIIEDSKHDNR